MLACFEVDCEWEGINPVYRVYVNDELFTERTWRWTDCYLRENICISAVPGQYRVRLEPVGPQIARFTTRKHAVRSGPGRWIDTETLEITA